MSDDSHHGQRRTIVFDGFYEDVERHLMSYHSCIYTFKISKSDEFDATFTSELPIVFSLVTAAIFMVMAFAFFIYDGFVRRRNTKVMLAAIRSTAIVSSLFPSTVRDQILAGEVGTSEDIAAASSKARLRNFVDNGHGTNDEKDDIMVLESKPIADLFPCKPKRRLKNASAATIHTHLTTFLPPSRYDCHVC